MIRGNSREDSRHGFVKLHGGEHRIIQLTDPWKGGLEADNEIRTEFRGTVYRENKPNHPFNPRK